MTSLPERIQADLRTAMRARDAAAARALRSVLAAFANAEAPPIDGRGPEETRGTLVDHHPLVLDDHDHRRLLAVEVAERDSAAAEYDALGRPEEAAAVRAELAALAAYR